MVVSGNKVIGGDNGIASVLVGDVDVLIKVW